MRWLQMQSAGMKTGARLWIQHDFLDNAKLKKAPPFYE